MTVAADPHPLLYPSVFETTFPRPLGELPSPPWLTALLGPSADAATASAATASAAMQAPEAIRQAVRALLRHGGFKPSGRAKPACEYLVRASQDGTLGSINAAVDACNVVSLHSGLPISVIDLDLATPPFRMAVADKTSYVFNASGQEMDLEGLLCLYDAHGPCANAVKDSQRTKTHGGTTRTLTVIWGHVDWKAHTDTATRWYFDLLQRLGASPQSI